MVFESVLVSVLNRFLSPYVKDLNASQLKVAIWSGEVKLENLTLKENALTQFDVPIRIFNGRIDKLHLKIPWKSLYTDPVVIEVDGVYVICGSEAATKYDPKKEAKENREVKMRKVKEIEEALTSQTDTAATDPGFVEKLVTQIIRNVQLTVRNIHIRYEDNIMSPDKPFSFGVTLDSLILLSTDENFRIVNSSTTTLIYKLVRMDCLAVYWNPVDKMIDGTASVNWKENLKDSIERRDHPNSQLKYILKPVSAEAKLKGTKLFDGKTPQLSIEFKLRCLSVKLSRDQVNIWILLIVYTCVCVHV
jgi:vacuolar protein sorting-associated protein 13A/C